MKAGDLKLTDLAAEQSLAEIMPWKEYVIDRVFLLKAKPEIIAKMASLSMKFRAEAAKLEAQKFIEMSKVVVEGMR